VKRKSPIRVRCRKLLFGYKACEWQADSHVRGALFQSRSKVDETAIVHPSSKHPGKWQVSFFDDRGPVSDSQHSSVNDALKTISTKRWRLRNVE
jgi:hypothetical protein